MIRKRSKQEGGGEGGVRKGAMAEEDEEDEDMEGWRKTSCHPVIISHSFIQSVSHFCPCLLIHSQLKHIASYSECAEI